MILSSNTYPHKELHLVSPPFGMRADGPSLPRDGATLHCGLSCINSTSTPSCWCMCRRCGRVFGGQKINGQSLHYSNPQHMLLKKYKIAKQ
ncbi:hypothetical protein E2C01_052239 [Portunus trituberculatus]|uniref:Uncharacterized protein n=1 Tax=Portunus trituberculatus TaxID=210409 RepID=A0A5B7GH12_PORTR|nr:hypothetical protein [Portunus trituberculatus]